MAETQDQVYIILYLHLFASFHLFAHSGIGNSDDELLASSWVEKRTERNAAFRPCVTTLVFVLQEQLTKRVKHNLENWRELVLPLHDVLLWKNIPLHPGIIFGACTFIFMWGMKFEILTSANQLLPCRSCSEFHYSLILLIDPTLLSFVSTVSLIAVIADYVVPLGMSKFCNPDSWTGAKEKKLEEISTYLATTYLATKKEVSHFFSLKESRPKVVRTQWRVRRLVHISHLTITVRSASLLQTSGFSFQGSLTKNIFWFVCPVPHTVLFVPNRMNTVPFWREPQNWFLCAEVPSIGNRLIICWLIINYVFFFRFHIFALRKVIQFAITRAASWNSTKSCVCVAKDRRERERRWEEKKRREKWNYCGKFISQHRHE